MIRLFVRWTCLFVVDIFYAEISVNGEENIPTDVGPVLVVANHPNGLLDPIILQIVLGRPVGFLAKSGLFENVFGKTAMESFGALPVYRAKDGADTKQNTSMFSACYDRFAEDGWIALFPEGISHSAPHLMPLKTGAARMSLDGQHKTDRPFKILPVGLVYEDKQIFRSRVTARVCPAINLSDQYGDSNGESRDAVTEVTTQMSTALASAMLSADSIPLRDGFLAVAEWTLGEGAQAKDVEVRARALRTGYAKMLDVDPAAANALLERSRHFINALKAVGVDDPFSIDPVKLSVPSIARYVFGAPVAALGWLYSWPVYFAIAPIAERMAGDDDDIISTIKALGGLFLYPPWWTLQSLTIAYFVGPWGFVASMAAAVVSSFYAMRYFERMARRRDVLQVMWWHRMSPNTVERLRQHRDGYFESVEQALDEYTL